MTNTTLTARQAVRMWLAQHDKNQRWLADRLSITPPLMSDILSGRKKAPPTVRKRLTRLTGVDIDAFARVA